MHDAPPRNQRCRNVLRTATCLLIAVLAGCDARPDPTAPTASQGRSATRDEISLELTFLSIPRSSPTQWNVSMVATHKTQPLISDGKTQGDTLTVTLTSADKKQLATVVLTRDDAKIQLSANTTAPLRITARGLGAAQFVRQNQPGQAEHVFLIPPETP